jgi:hypothetical protein
MTNLTAPQITQLNNINTNTITMTFGQKVQDIITAINASHATATPVNAVNATKTLTISGVVTHGETVTITNPAMEAPDVYEFLADDAQTKTDEDNIAVDIAIHSTKSLQSLTVDTQPTSGDTMTIGTKVYTFVPVGTDTADGEISIGADLAAAKLNIVAAINGDGAFNEPHPLVSAAAFVGDICAISALIGGVAGDTIATTETFTANTNIFGGATLGGGVSCTQADAVTALVLAITASDTQGVGAADGAGDTVVLTADTAGVVGNAIEIAETMTNGAFAGGATALSGGVDGTVGKMTEPKVDGSYLYVCVADNTISDKNWRRISVGSAY